MAGLVVAYVCEVSAVSGGSSQGDLVGQVS